MAVIETKYSVGDVAYLASTTTERKQHPCPDCKGTRKWTATSPAGEEYAIPCPRCSKLYRGMDELSLDYSASVPIVRRLTIGSVRTDSHRSGNDAPVTYMCQETGVGSGNIWNEGDLFPSEAEALKAAAIKAALSNETTPWIVKRYNQSLEISDYQLTSAAMKAAKDYKSRASSLLWNLTDLFAAIEEADDKDAIQEAVAEYKEWHWKRDLKALAAQGGEAGTATTGTGVVHEHPVAESDAPNPLIRASTD